MEVSGIHRKLCVFSMLSSLSLPDYTADRMIFQNIPGKVKSLFEASASVPVLGCMVGLPEIDPGVYKRLNVTLFRKGVFADVIKLKISRCNHLGFRVGLKSSDRCP